jgi:hypothetical protein
MFLRTVHFLLAFVVMVQGGCLRACQLHEIIIGGNDGDYSEAYAVPSGSCGQTAGSKNAILKISGDDNSKSPGKSETCSCEYRKGLATPDRLDTGMVFNFSVPVRTLDTLAPVAADFPTVPVAAAMPVPVHLQDRPLLI